MRIYLVYNIGARRFLRFGVNGGGLESYCLYQGEPCYFWSYKEAEVVINTFDHPEDYEIRTFAEVGNG
ncbi:MAG: hypothetical protein J6V72_19815 [Kiritimatiellae bacterium]|nr:hypothetical protein [Kiritimatiellia bacterium]